MGGRARSARPPIFVSYIFDYTFDFFGFGPIFDQCFWNLFRKLIQIRENGEILVLEIMGAGTENIDNWWSGERKYYS